MLLVKRKKFKKVPDAFILSEDAEACALRLALLKENFNYQDEFLKIHDLRFLDWEHGDPDKLEEAQSRIMNFLKSFGLKYPNGFECSWPPDLIAFFDPKEDAVKVNYESDFIPQGYLGKVFMARGITRVEPMDRRFLDSTGKFEWIEKIKLEPYHRVLKIDLRIKRSRLIKEFEVFIDQVFDHHKKGSSPKYQYDAWEPDTKRQREEARLQLAVWRRRREKVPFSKIAEDLGIAEDSAKKAFYRAYEITQREKFDPDQFRREAFKLKIISMEKTCDACPDRVACNIICPEIRQYADQDKRKMNWREKLFEKIEIF